MNLYHIKLTDNQKNALNYLFAQDIKWNKTELEKAWQDLREQLKESVQCVAIINALQDSGCNCKKPTEPDPKYDPCRLFRAGDIVEPCQVKGRWFGTAWKNRSGIRFTVTKDEDEEGVMWVKDPDSLHPKDVEAVFFQLVTPVEELEPYIIEESTDGATLVLTVKKRDCSQGLDFRWCPGWGGNIFFSKKHCRNHAESERDRLNAEYRKENA